MADPHSSNGTDVPTSRAFYARVSSYAEWIDRQINVRSARRATPPFHRHASSTPCGLSYARDLAILLPGTAAAPESNWIQTVSGRAFLVALRLYGTGTEFYDQTWKPDDVIKVR